jgi:hypothetical protein
MRILFNHPKIKGVLDMARELEKLGYISGVYDSSMENAYNFKMNGIDFFILYDGNSAKNDQIFQYNVESHNENAQEGTEEDKEATEELYERIKNIATRTILESDE